LWRGTVPTDSQGLAKVSLAVPPFSGRLRVTVVAAGEQGVGAGASTVIVRDPLVVQASFPRFLAPGDAFEIPVTVSAQAGLGGEAEVELHLTGEATPSGSLSRTVTLPTGGEVTVRFNLQAPAVPGSLGLRASATLGDLQASDQAQLSVRPPSSLRYLSGAGVIKAGVTTRLVMPGGWLPQTDHYTLAFSASPMLKYGRGLRYLLRYPYGCLEQTTSGAMPLLYLGELAELVDPALGRKNAIPIMVQSGLDRVLSMQVSGGGFALWPNQDFAYPWGSIYATHFILEAQRAGYAVSAANLSSAMDYLEREVLSRPACDDATRAYAAYVLALAGRVNELHLAGLLERRNRLPEWGRHLLVAALAAARRPEAARALHDEEVPPAGPLPRDTGGTLHSPGRAAAIHLLALLELDPAGPLVINAVRRVERELRDGYWGSTQENAFALLALGRYARLESPAKAQYRGLVMMDNQELYDFTQNDQVLVRPPEAGGKEIKIMVEGKGSLYYYWSAEGVPLTLDLPEEDSALKVRRRYLDRQGQQLDPKALPHGEVLVVELTLSADYPMDNVAVSDLLPAGLEIENPRLDTTDAESWMSSDDALVPERVEMRDDRLLIFVRLPSGTRTYRYGVRAVTRGEFVLPPVSASAMYDPALRSVAGGGRVVIR
jgi:alpha-2-macroglobulin